MARCRAFLLMGLGLVAAPLGAGAQPTAKVYRVGVLHPGSGSETRLAVLRDAGYVEGQNLVLERRHAEGRVDRLPVLAEELVHLKPDVIIATGTQAIQAAKDATKTVPIVMAYSEDPVARGFVASLARPGGNITGVSLVAGGVLAAKRMELLKEAVPRARRVGLLGSGRVETQVEEANAAARLLGVDIVAVEVHDGDYTRAFAMLRAERADALFVLSSPILNRDRKRIIEQAVRHKLPAIYEWRESAEDGGLLAYGASIRDLNRRVAVFVDKILKGAKPADLPVEQPTMFELAVNLRTAKTLGLTIPQSVLARADHVIR